jgi:hypothetical protein
VAAIGDETGGDIEAGLFNEAHDLQHVDCASGFGFDVAEARFRCRRPDTEEGDPTLPYEG